MLVKKLVTVYVLVIMPATVHVCMCEFGTSNQAPKSGTAKPNSDSGKSVKASVNIPIYRIG